MMRKIVSSVLLVILLAVTIGLPVYRHTCHVFDRSEVSLASQDQCCPSNTSGEEAILDFKCCSLEHIDTALDYESLLSEFATELPVFIAPASVVINQVSFTELASAELPVLRPPPANRELLNLIQVYLI